MDDKEKDTEGKNVQQTEAVDSATGAVGAASDVVIGEDKKPTDNGKEEREEKKPESVSNEKENDAGGKNGESDKKKKEGTRKEGKTVEESLSSVLGNKTIEEVIKREAKEEQDTTSPFSLSRTLGGVMIARAFQKQMGLVCLICAFFIIYINNRYVCQKRMVEIDKIERKMVDARYKATVCTSILTEKSRESNVIQLLGSYGDSTLAIPNEPPYLIRVDE